MEIHFMVPPLKVASLDQTFKHTILDHKLLLLFSIILYKFRQEAVLQILKRLESTIWTSVMDRFDVHFADKFLASAAGDGVFGPFETYEACVFALVV